MKRLFYTTPLRIAVILFAAATLAMTACTGNKVYDQYEHTPLAGWEKNDTLTFDVAKAAEAGTYASSLMLRINESFPFMSLTLIVEQQILPSHDITTDTLHCSLIDSGGNFNGQGISYHQYRFPITTMPLAAGDSLHISVRHDMKREILPGISDVGIMISKEK